MPGLELPFQNNPLVAQVQETDPSPNPEAINLDGQLKHLPVIETDSKFLYYSKTCAATCEIIWSSPQLRDKASYTSCVEQFVIWLRDLEAPGKSSGENLFRRRSVDAATTR